MLFLEKFRETAFQMLKMSFPIGIKLKQKGVFLWH